MHRYKGLFNFQGTTYPLYTTAKCQEAAWHNFMNQLAKLFNVGKRSMMFFFDGSKDNYRIERR